jgi:hypothetical protein
LVPPDFSRLLRTNPIYFCAFSQTTVKTQVNPSHDLNQSAGSASAARRMTSRQLPATVRRPRSGKVEIKNPPLFGAG